tara:strand:- start:48 stop:308 length:261 start_codon:yes stop_codon:yes gene_type:complete
MGFIISCVPFPKRLNTFIPKKARAKITIIQVCQGCDVMELNADADGIDADGIDAGVGSKDGGIVPFKLCSYCIEFIYLFTGLYYLA